MNNKESIEKALDFHEQWFTNFKLPTPSYYHIETYINKLYEEVKKYKPINESVKINLIAIEFSVDILRADLRGVLKSDFEKKLVRYREKWINYHEAIDDLKNKFLLTIADDIKKKQRAN